MTKDAERTVVRNAAIRLFKSGMRQSEISDALQIPNATIRRWLADEGLIVTSQTLATGVQRAVEPGRHDVSRMARVDRDPCPRCQVRKDIGCKHFPKGKEVAVMPSALLQAEALFRSARS